MSRQVKATKNDIAWEKIFDTYNVLDSIESKELYFIDSTTINKYRESRLMAKMDHRANLPRIFDQHQLSILPVSRSQYVIGHFDTHKRVHYDGRENPKPVSIPSYLESIDASNLYSEQSALLFAFNSGIIADLLGGEPYFTLTGRMTSGDFTFRISDILQPSKHHSIEVNNSQIEIDAGFETKTCLALVEAKNQLVEDFNTRQLYYPYRLWSSRVQKPVKSILMTFSNDIFSFFVYDFLDPSNYSSAELVGQYHYSLASDVITKLELQGLLARVQCEPEPPELPFPQANSFERLIDLLGLLFDGRLSKDDITVNYEFDERQSDYYTRAGMYLGLIARDNDGNYELSNDGRAIMQLNSKDKRLRLIERILSRRAFYETFVQLLQTGEMPATEEVANIISQVRPDISGSTPRRRASTVTGWIKWIIQQVEW